MKQRIHDGGTEETELRSAFFRCFRNPRGSSAGVWVGLLIVAMLVITTSVMGKPDSDEVRYLSPREMVLSPDGHWLYVMCEASDEVRVVDTKNDTVVKTVAVGHVPRGIALSPDGRQFL